MPPDWPILAIVAAFVAAACVIWAAGTRLARCADVIARRTGVGRAYLGLLLLGGVTSLPELAVAVTSSLEGHPLLSVNDVLGSAAINVLILAVLDRVVRDAPLSSMTRSPISMLQAVIGMMLLAAVVGPSITGDRVVLGLGLWSWAMLAAYAIALRVLRRAEGLHSWVPSAEPKRGRRQTAAAADRSSNARLYATTAMAGLAILLAGWALARTGAALAERSGLGDSFFGAVCLAVVTSLPEASTALAAIRLGRHEMAIADVFGTNMFNVLVIVVVDAIVPGGPVLAEAGPFAAFGALLALVMTALFLAGMIERRDRTVARFGIDSLAVCATYAVGLVVLYQLR